MEGKNMIVVSAIIATALRGVIGWQNDMPWRGKVPDDMKRFRTVTKKAGFVIMGRVTWESISAASHPTKKNPSGEPLPGRVKIIVTRKPSSYKVSYENCIVAGSPEDAINHALISGAKEVVVIGGVKLLESTLRFISKIYLTRIHAQFAGDTFMPELGIDWEYQFNGELPADDRNQYPLKFFTLERELPKPIKDPTKDSA